MKRFLYILLLAGIAAACHQPEIIIEDFDTFKVTSIKPAPVAMEDGTLNPDIRLMETNCDEPETKVAVTTAALAVQSILGVTTSNSVINIAGTYTGHDIDGSPITLSGKLLVPAKGPVKNLVIVSHYTIGANYECPSECFPLEGILAAKGYAVVMADYIGFGITADRIHPYMHVESTARSVVDMALAVKPYLEHIGKKPESNQVILMGYSQGGATTLGVMRLIQREYYGEFPIKKVYCGGGPYDLAATYDTAIEMGKTGIPCAIPMIVQGVNAGQGLGLDLKNFFTPKLLSCYNELINSKQYTVKGINVALGTNNLHDLMTEGARDKHNPKTAKLYKALMINSVLDFWPSAPIFMFHSLDDQTVPFENALKAEQAFKGIDISFDFGHYGNHGNGAIMFITNVAKIL